MAGLSLWSTLLLCATFSISTSPPHSYSAEQTGFFRTSHQFYPPVSALRLCHPPCDSVPSFCHSPCKIASSHSGWRQNSSPELSTGINHLRGGAGGGARTRIEGASRKGFLLGTQPPPST
eukprot:2080239-Rhodomonas_salina.1